MVTSEKGFTLVEFIVIISIFSIMATVALVNFRSFRGDLAVNNLAHDISLVLRQAQTTGWANLTDPNTLNQFTTTGISRYAHGVFFKYDQSQKVFSPDIVLYSKRDSSKGNEFFSGDVREVTETITIDGPYRIVAIKNASSKESLFLDNFLIPAFGVQSMDDDVSIAFSRPKPDPLVFLGQQNIITDPSAQFFGIYLGSSEDVTKAQKLVIISRMGEIMVIQ